MSCRAFRREKNILPTRLLEKKNSCQPEITHPPPPSRVKWSAPYLGVFSFQGFEYMLHNQNNTRAVLIALLNDMHETL